MIRFLSLIVFCILGSEMTSQTMDYCGTDGINEEWASYVSDHEGLLATTRNCNLNIPITVHVLGDDNGVGYLSLASIFGSLQTLNQDYASSGISFFLSGPINYLNNTSWYDHASFSTGTQMMNSNNVENTINCYIVDNAAGNCGYRAFSGDAIALAKSCTQPQDHTWAHEMGHWLSLPHTFFGWEGTDYDKDAPTPSRVGSSNVELWNSANCTSSADRICDTKSDYLSFRWNCNDEKEYTDSLTDPTGTKFAVDGSLFMSYAFDRCQTRFSAGQVTEMCTYLQSFVPEVISTEPPLGAVDISDTELIYPIDGEKVQGSVQLQWEENGNATFYIVEVSRSPNLGILSVRELVQGNKLDVFGLTDGKSYYWRVRALNEYDFEYNNKSAIEKFETGELSSTVDYYAERLKVYPNPIEKAESLHIQLDSQVGETVTVRLNSMDGKTAFIKPYFVKNGSNDLEVNVSNLSAGIYILSGIGDLHKFQKKIVIK